MSLLRLLIFIPLQILFVPMAILGVILVSYRQIKVSKTLGVSQTAIEVLNGRWTMHIFGIREDEATDKLANTLANTSVIGLWLTLAPLWLTAKLTGGLFLYPRIPDAGDEDLRDLIVARTLYIDRLIENAMDRVEQVVFLGAGYDTRAYGKLARENATFFELDQIAVQTHKRQALADASISSEHVRFVPVDFSNDDAFSKLAEAGYDPDKRTLFLWEGVTLYLREADVRKTIQEVRRHSPAGSVFIADLYSETFVKKLGGSGGAKKLLEYTNEGLAFGLPMAADYEKNLSDFIESESMSVGDTFFMGENSSKGPYMVIVEVKQESAIS